MRRARSASRMRPLSAAATHLRKLTAAGSPRRGQAYSTETSRRTGPLVIARKRTPSGAGTGRAVVGVAGVVGVDDARDQRMADDVARLEEGEADAVHAAQHLDRIPQARLLVL